MPPRGRKSAKAGKAKAAAAPAKAAAAPVKAAHPDTERVCTNWLVSLFASGIETLHTWLTLVDYNNDIIIKLIMIIILKLMITMINTWFRNYWFAFGCDQFALDGIIDGNG